MALAGREAKGRKVAQELFCLIPKRVHRTVVENGCCVHLVLRIVHETANFDRFGRRIQVSLRHKLPFD